MPQKRLLWAMLSLALSCANINDSVAQSKTDVVKGRLSNSGITEENQVSSNLGDPVRLSGAACRHDCNQQYSVCVMAPGNPLDVTFGRSRSYGLCEQKCYYH